MMKKFEESYWETKREGKIKIKDLTPQHLKNIIKYLKNKMDNPFDFYPCFSGDMAQYVAQQEWDEYEKKYSELKDLINNFEKYYESKFIF